MEVKEKRTYQAVIGLEFHVHLATRTKMFCGCRVTYGGPPNTHTCPVCLGHPGALPVTNERAIELGVMAGLALNCDVAERAVFARKNYFYPDLPKGYQISQYDAPICTGGYLDVPDPAADGAIRVGITRLHLEEDAAKNIHVGESGRMHGSVGSLVDFNRGGTPLMEIVTEPDIPSPEAARATANQLKNIMRAIGVSEADMEKGQLRVDANVSVRNPDGTFGTKTELKNMNSFRFVERGLARELERQIGILQSGGSVEQTTLHYDPDTDEVHELRSKEYAHDYRYFPEPDLLPLELAEAWIREIKSRLPELPDQMRTRFMKEYNLSEYDAGVLTADGDHATYYEKVAAAPGVDPKQAANWITVELRGRLNEAGTEISESKVGPERLADLIGLVGEGTISRSAAKDVLDRIFETGESPSVVVEREGLAALGGDELSVTVDEVIAANPEEAERVRGGDQKVIGFLIGQVMRATRGNADGGRVRELLLQKLESQKPVLRSAPRIGVIDSEEGGRVDAIREAGGEPAPLVLRFAHPGGGVALAREWVADVIQISCAQEHLDGLLVAADEPEELSGFALAALRLNVPTVVAPSGDAHLSAALAALGFVPLDADPEEVAVRVATGGEPRPRELVEEFALSNALRAAFSLGGGPEVIVHLSAIAREAGAAGFSEMLRVLVPETTLLVEPTSGWFREHGVAGLLAHLAEALHHSRSVEGELKMVLPQAPSAPPPAVESRLVIVRGRASGTEALCRMWGSQKEVAGRCRVVDSEKLAVQALEGGALEPDSLLVVRGCGPRGGPGLPRLERLAQALRETGLEESVSVITDGLPPREALGTWVSLVSPEAAAGGVIGQLRDRDTLRIDLVEGRIRTGVKADEMEGREPYKPPDPAGAGYVDRYARSALPALEGAGFG